MMMDGPDALSAALRAVSFTLLLNAAGIPIFLAAFGHLMPNTLPDVKRLGVQLAIAALVFVGAHQAFEAARMAGEMAGIADPAMQRMALLSPAGAAFAARILGMVLVAAALRPATLVSQRASPPPADTHNAPRLTGASASTGTATASIGAPVSTDFTTAPIDTPTSTGTRMPFNPEAPYAATLRGASPATWVALFGTLLTTTSFTLMGHTTTTPHRIAAVALITLHLLVVAFWLGALGPLYLAAKKEPPTTAARVIEQFSIAAAWIVPLLLLAGIGLAALLLPSLATFKQPYGQWLLVKVTGFAVLMAFASLNKWHFGPACADGDTTAFKRTVGIEYVLICAVLTATALMTTFYSPEPG